MASGLRLFNLPEGTTVVGVWIALDEATPENGCLHVIPGSNIEGPMIHFKRRDWQICDTDVPIGRDTMVPLKPGGCLFWHGLTHQRKSCQPIGTTAAGTPISLRTGECWRDYNTGTDGCLWKRRERCRLLSISYQLSVISRRLRGVSVTIYPNLEYP